MCIFHSRSRSPSVTSCQVLEVPVSHVAISGVAHILYHSLEKDGQSLEALIRLFV